MGKKGQKQELLHVENDSSFCRKTNNIGCMDCIKERTREPNPQNNRRQKKARSRRDFPLVVHLQDSIKATMRGKLKPAMSVSLESLDSLEGDSYSSDDSQMFKNISQVDSSSSGEDSHNTKNIHNALLSALEKSHNKVLTESTKNLDQALSGGQDSKQSSVLLNNLVSESGDTSATKQPRILELSQGNVDVICNDLSDGTTIKQGPQAERTTPETTELSKEELQHLTAYTTGFPLMRYTCQPNECPECSPAFSTYHPHYAQGSDIYRYCHTDEESDSSSSSASSISSDSVRNACTKKSNGHVEVSVAFLNRKSHKRKQRRTKKKCSYMYSNSVFMDLTDTKISFTVHRHPEPEHLQQAYSDWYYSFYAYQAYLMYSLPYLMVPVPYYLPYPLYTTVTEPLCVPRDTSCLNSQRLCMVPAHEIRNFTASQPPQRPWIPCDHPERTKPVALYTVMCYNVLCDKYATRQLYGYCPSWALNWEYRKKGIIEEIRHYSADIISLQEVETDQFYNFFLPELKRDGYNGIFSPKSRARTMQENDRKHVDGCAIFFKVTKFSLLKEALIEFNQLAMAASEGSHDMLNRVMTKDNIGLAALLETKEAIWENGLPPESQINQPILVATCHVHWDPEFCDVKLIQTMMLMSELQNLIDESTTSLRPGSNSADSNHIPLILCGDLNSLPESEGVMWDQWKRVHMVLYKDSNLSWYKDRGSATSQGRVVLKAVSPFIAIGTYCRAVPKNPKLPYGDSIEQLIAVPFEPKKDSVINWFLAENEEDLQSWMEAMNSTQPAAPTQQNPSPPPPSQLQSSKTMQPSKQKVPHVQSVPDVPQKDRGYPQQQYSEYNPKSQEGQRNTQPKYVLPRSGSIPQGAYARPGNASNADARRGDQGEKMALGFLGGMMLGSTLRGGHGIMGGGYGFGCGHGWGGGLSHHDYGLMDDHVGIGFGHGGFGHGIGGFGHHGGGLGHLGGGMGHHGGGHH